MGIVQVTVTIRNPSEPRRSWDCLFLVDTGSTDCLVPGRALRRIGIEVDPVSQRLKRRPSARMKNRPSRRLPLLLSLCL